MTIEEASKFLGITRTHVAVLLDSGILPSLEEHDVVDFLPQVFHGLDNAPDRVQLVNTEPLTGLYEELL